MFQFHPEGKFINLSTSFAVKSGHVAENTAPDSISTAIAEHVRSHNLTMCSTLSFFKMFNMTTADALMYNTQ